MAKVLCMLFDFCRPSEQKIHGCYTIEISDYLKSSLISKNNAVDFNSKAKLVVYW